MKWFVALKTRDQNWKGASKRRCSLDYRRTLVDQKVGPNLENVIENIFLLLIALKQILQYTQSPPLTL